MFLCSPLRGAATSSRQCGWRFRLIKGCSWTVYGPTATSISRTVLRITGSWGNSCSTRSPRRPLFGSGVGVAARSHGPSVAPQGVRVSVFSVTLRRDRKPSSSLCSCWTCRTGGGPLQRFCGLGVRRHSLPRNLGLRYQQAAPKEGLERGSAAAAASIAARAWTSATSAHFTPLAHSSCSQPRQTLAPQRFDSSHVLDCSGSHRS